MNLALLLFEHPFADDVPLLHTIDRSMTAGAARAEAHRVAAELVRELVPPVRPAVGLDGMAVAVQLPNGPELVATMVAVWLAGGVYVPVNPRFPDPEVAAVLAATRPVGLVTPAGIVRLGPGPVESGPAGSGLAGVERRQQQPEEQQPERYEPERYEPDVAFVMWTSGTTGPPKPIRHTHDAYVELLDRVLGPLRGGESSGGSNHERSRRPTPNLIPVSMALNAGLYNALFGLRAGAALVMMDRFEPHDFAQLVRRFEIRSTVLPPAAMVSLTDSDLTATDLVPLRYVRSITAPLSPLHARRFVERFGVHVLNGYGQAEMGEVIGWTAADAKDHPDKVGAIGRPHPGVEIRVDAGDHLWVRPPNTAAGIDDRKDADGFIDTGDLARIDDEGFVWIDGRAGDVINRGGNKVMPGAVEEVLRLSPAVADVAVVGAPDERLGEVPVAFLVGRPVPDEDLITLCLAHLVAYKVPSAFDWVDELPRTEVGKVLRQDLVARLTT